MSGPPGAAWLESLARADIALYVAGAGAGLLVWGIGRLWRHGVTKSSSSWASGGILALGVMSVCVPSQLPSGSGCAGCLDAT